MSNSGASVQCERSLTDRTLEDTVSEPIRCSKTAVETIAGKRVCKTHANQMRRWQEIERQKDARRAAK